MKDSAPLHEGAEFALREDRLHDAQERDPEHGWLDGLLERGRAGAGHFWSQVATDILAQKYFRKAGVPARLRAVPEAGVPEWLWRPRARRPGARGPAGRSAQRRRDGRPAGLRPPGRLLDLLGLQVRATSRTRRAHRAYYDEMRFMLAAQMAAPNSPQWFNTGLHWAYGITGPAQGHYYATTQSGEVHASTSAYERPQPHACFIQGVSDDLVNEGGIMDLWVREARLFKYGSGHGQQLLRPARRGRAAVRRRPLQRADELPAHRRPRGGGDQERRHHPPRRQDGHARRRPPGHRGLHQLEGP
jgi:hypothetical protein